MSHGLKSRRRIQLFHLAHFETLVGELVAGTVGLTATIGVALTIVVGKVFAGCVS